MKGFYNIFINFFPNINLNKHAFEKSHNKKYTYNTDFVSYSLINLYNREIENKTQKSKFEILLEPLLNNVEINDVKREEMLESFYKSQSIYNIFSKAARRFKIRRAKTNTIDTDLYMNPLSSIKTHLKIDVYDDESRTIYTFRISNLIAIIKAALSHAPDFFADPCEIKNPYTNIPFTDAQLYSIYFRLKFTTYVIPNIFHLFFECNFNINIFFNYNECYIRELAIQNFMESGTDSSCLYYIQKIIRDYKKELNNIYIYPSFKSEILLKAFKPFLYHYLLSEYSLNPSLRHFSRVRLKSKLKRFVTLNPSFGKRVIRRSESDNVSEEEYLFSYAEDINLYTPPVSPNNMHAFVRTISNINDYGDYGDYGDELQNNISVIPSNTSNENIHEENTSTTNSVINSIIATENTVDRLNLIRERLSSTTDLNPMDFARLYSERRRRMRQDNTLYTNSAQSDTSQSSQALLARALSTHSDPALSHNPLQTQSERSPELESPGDIISDIDNAQRVIDEAARELNYLRNVGPNDNIADRPTSYLDEAYERYINNVANRVPDDISRNISNVQMVNDNVSDYDEVHAMEDCLSESGDALADMDSSEYRNPIIEENSETALNTNENLEYVPPNDNESRDNESRDNESRDNESRDF